MVEKVTVMGIPGLLMIALVAAAVMLVHPKGLQPVKTLAKIMPSGFLITPRIHDEFMGVGEYRNLVLPNGKFGLGFRRFSSSDGSFYGFGHSGMGGSIGFCDITEYNHVNRKFFILVYKLTSCFCSLIFTL
jgi:hypothetical protein